MASATVSDVRAKLPAQIKDTPSESEIENEYLPLAVEKVSHYTEVTGADVAKAEALYAAYLLVSFRYPIPTTEREAGFTMEYKESLEKKLIKEFHSIARTRQMKVI